MGQTGFCENLQFSAKILKTCIPESRCKTAHAFVFPPLSDRQICIRAALPERPTLRAGSRKGVFFFRIRSVYCLENKENSQKSVIFTGLVFIFVICPYFSSTTHLIQKNARFARTSSRIGLTLFCRNDC